jgi:hypothetical protein
MLKDTSFEDVDMAEYPAPIGTWPKDPALKDLGRCFRAQFVDGAVESYTLALFTRTGKWTFAEVQVLLAQLRSELRGNKIHVYARLCVTSVFSLVYRQANGVRGFATGQKPQ